MVPSSPIHLSMSRARFLSFQVTSVRQDRVVKRTVQHGISRLVDFYSLLTVSQDLQGLNNGSNMLLMFYMHTHYRIYAQTRQTPPQEKHTSPTSPLSKSRISQVSISSSQSMISQLSTLSRIISLWRSIFQFVYKCLVAMAAFRWPGPAPPFLASSRDLQMQVAKLRPSTSGSPYQYLCFFR